MKNFLSTFFLVFTSGAILALGMLAIANGLGSHWTIP